MVRFSYIFVGVFLLFGSAFADSAEKVEPASLAVLVGYEPNSGDFAGKLQPLLEAEASMQWTGRLVERAKLNKLLEELKISISGLVEQRETGSDKRLQLGKLIQMDCLLSVKVESDSVKATVSLFPSTAVIYEQTYHERLEPHPLAVNIITDALKAFRERDREPNRPQISVGSFYYADPHRRFFKFSRAVSVQLRRELLQTEHIVLVERFFPSGLLSEFELTRGGLTAHVARSLSAPASDILLYGEFQPRPEQELKSKAAVLDYTLVILSPTGLCENRRMESSCLSSEPDAVTRQALKLIEQAAVEVRMRLATGEKRRFSEQEFEAFKKQAFRSMPNPPYEDGDFARQEYSQGAEQYGSPEDLERALHMLECAMLFKGNDTQVLVCTGAVLDGLARRTSKYSASAKDALLDASLELIERAYYLDSNWNTRGMYFHFCVYQEYSGQRPPGYFKAAKHIWNTRKVEPWNKNHIHFALHRILKSQTDPQQNYRLFLEAVHEFEKETNGLGVLYSLFEVLILQVYTSDGSPQVIQQAHHFAQRLLEEQSLYLRSLGHMLHLAVYDKIGRTDKDNGVPVEFAEHFRGAINMLADLYEKYGYQFESCSYSIRLCGFFDTYEEVVQKHSLKNDSSELKERYIAVQMNAGNYTDLGIPPVFSTLLLEMWARREYNRAVELITEFLENYNVGGDPGDTPMWLARQYNRFMFAMQGKPPLSINQLDKVEFDDNGTGCVTKLLASENGLFGIRGSRYNYSGKSFHLAPGAQRANILKQIFGEVRDLACAGSFVGITTKSNGFYLLDTRSLETRNFTPENSGFPSKYLTLICDSGSNFLIGVGEIIYRLDVKAAKISRTDTRSWRSPRYWRMKLNTLGTKQYPSVVIPQTWNHRTTVTNGKTLEFSSSRKANIGIKDVTVRSAEDGLLLSYRGFELSYVFDFVLWQGQLIFATGNGLYTSKPGSNEIQCLLSEPDLLVLCLCPLNDRLYIGTSNGLYCLGTDHFIEMVKKPK